MIRIRALTPKRQITAAGIQREFNRYLRNFRDEFIEEMEEYPPEQPWRSRTPTSGPRAGGRRTGAYGRGWRENVRFTPQSVIIINPVRYAIVVGGSRSGSPGQAHVLADRGWKSIEDVGPEVAERNLPEFTRVIYTGG